MNAPGRARTRRASRTRPVHPILLGRRASPVQRESLGVRNDRMWSRTEFAVGEDIGVNPWGPFHVTRVNPPRTASTRYGGFFGVRRRPGKDWTVQAINTRVVSPNALAQVESKLGRMRALKERPIQYIEGLYDANGRPDLLLVVLESDPADALPLRQFLRMSAPQRAMLAWHTAHAIFLSLAELHAKGLVCDEITLDTILVEPQDMAWHHPTWGSRLRSAMRLRSQARHFEASFVPNLYLRGFAVDRLLENGSLDAARVPQRAQRHDDEVDGTTARALPGAVDDLARVRQLAQARGVCGISVLSPPDKTTGAPSGNEGMSASHEVRSLTRPMGDASPNPSTTHATTPGRWGARTALGGGILVRRGGAAVARGRPPRSRESGR